MSLIDDYFAIQQQVFAHFGYVEDWRVLPLSDHRRYYWQLDGEGPGEVHFADTEDELRTQEGNYYTAEIYTQRHLPKWVYRAADLTLVCVDTQTDGNQLLAVFDNAKERHFEIDE